MFEDQLKVLSIGDLLTADKNYGYFNIIKSILKTKSDYCIRLSQSTSFIKEFIKSGKKDEIVEWFPSKSSINTCKKHNIDIKPIKIRLVRIDLSDNEIEILGTSLLNQSFYKYKDIIDLYNQRWVVEEEIKKYMQRLMLECFSSIKDNGILQDFYANIFMQNLVSFISNPTNEEIKEQSKTNKFTRQINWTSALSDVRSRFILLVLRDFNTVHMILESIWESLKINTEAIRPKRKFARDKRKKGSRCKYYMQYKPAW